MVPLPSSVRYEGEWFYARNIAGSAPQFTSQELTSVEERCSRTDVVLKSEVGCLLAAAMMLKQLGLSGARLVHVFMHPRIQPLMARQKPMHQYSGVNDPDRHSLMLLALFEIEARVKVAMAPSSGSFMNEDSPHPLHKNVASDLVGFLLLVFFALLSFFLFRFMRVL